MLKRGPVAAARLLILAVFLAACGGGGNASNPGDSGSTSATGAGNVDLAPELTGIEGWYNSEPLTLAALRGQPVLLVFWRDT